MGLRINDGVEAVGPRTSDKSRSGLKSLPVTAGIVRSWHCLSSPSHHAPALVRDQRTYDVRRTMYRDMKAIRMRSRHEKLVEPAVTKWISVELIIFSASDTVPYIASS